jgi:hypothetical protein
VRTENRIVMGICMPRALKETIDKARGDIPRSTYISRILEQKYKEEKEGNGNYYNVENQQSKSRGQPGHGTADSSDFPSTDLKAGVVNG